jgi:hypothetical protein
LNFAGIVGEGTPHISAGSQKAKVFLFAPLISARPSMIISCDGKRP